MLGVFLPVKSWFFSTVHKARSTDPSYGNIAIMETKNEDERYYSTEFAKQITQIIENPKILDTKEKLKSLWILALEARAVDKSIQQRIAAVAAREIGAVEYENTEEDPYQAVILQFLSIDHMHEGYGADADKEWEKLASMIANL